VRAVAFAFPGGGSFTVPMLLLALMLLTAGLGVRVGDLAGVVRSPLRMASGVAVNALLPVVLLPIAAVFLRVWPDAGEVECLTVGLLLVLSMPIAGGAASWGAERRRQRPPGGRHGGGLDASQPSHHPVGAGLGRRSDRPFRSREPG
jgi:hypothetical protein